MTISYDGYINRIHQAGGISRYLANLVDGLPADWTSVLPAHVTRPFAFPTHTQLVLKRFGDAAILIDARSGDSIIGVKTSAVAFLCPTETGPDSSDCSDYNAVSGINIIK